MVDCSELHSGRQTSPIYTGRTTEGFCALATESENHLNSTGFPRNSQNVKAERLRRRKGINNRRWLARNWQGVTSAFGRWREVLALGAGLE